MPTYRRRFRVILPSVQLRLIAAMAAVAVLALLLEYMLLAGAVVKIADELPNDGDILIAEASSSLAWVLGVSVAVVLPVLFTVAVLVSHRFCGPIYRFQLYLSGVISGAERGECVLRKGDDLQELCALINQATVAARRATPQPAVEPDGRRAA